MATMVEHLERAQAEILAVETQLNDAAHACGACGLRVCDNFTEAQVKKELAALRRKLARFAGSDAFQFRDASAAS